MSCVVAGLLVGFEAGPAVGLQPWMCAAAADVVLAVVTRWVPWREVALVQVVLGSTAAASALNNLPALPVVPDGVGRMSWGVWAWLHAAGGTAADDAFRSRSVPAADVDRGQNAC